MAPTPLLTPYSTAYKFPLPSVQATTMGVKVPALTKRINQFVSPTCSTLPEKLKLKAHPKTSTTSSASTQAATPANLTSKIVCARSPLSSAAVANHRNKKPPTPKKTTSTIIVITNPPATSANLKLD